MYVSGLYIARSIESVGTPMTPDASDPSNTCLPVRSLYVGIARASDYCEQFT